MKLTETRLRQIIREELEGATEQFALAIDDARDSAEDYGYFDPEFGTGVEGYINDLRELVMQVPGVTMEYDPDSGDPGVVIHGTLEAMKRFGEADAMNSHFSYNEEEFLRGLIKL